ncbi:MAG: hypothetical protein HY904_25090 [Deltaproteobacteria bacterium]|nr:hypothetical protein [Deltaproteobacteria bacterium]
MTVRAAWVALFIALPQAAHAGHTHYWTWLAPPDAHAVELAVAGMQRLAASRPDVAVTLERGDAGTVGITLNGVGADAHEPFVFPGKDRFNFCKTAQKPYDDVVTAALILARDHFDASVLRVESDGAWEAGAWVAGAQLYREVTGRDARNPVSAPSAERLPPADDTRLRVDGRWFLVLGLGLLALLLWRAV